MNFSGRLRQIQAKDGTKRYTVRLMRRQQVDQSSVVTVTAQSEEEAIRKAREMGLAMSNAKWTTDDTVNTLEPISPDDITEVNINGHVVRKRKGTKS